MTIAPFHPLHKSAGERMPSLLPSNVSTELLKISTEIADEAALNAASVDRVGGFPASDFDRLVDAGLLRAPLRSDLGGIGLGFESNRMGLLLQILKQIGRGNLSLGRVFEGHVNALQLIQTFAKEEQIRAFAKDAHSRKAFGVWNAEAKDGVKLYPIGEERYRMEGSKTFCSGCGYVERPFVTDSLPAIACWSDERLGHLVSNQDYADSVE
ncbi:hypothetical protein S7335_4371 [Synechococcus sp. PCC 7335]|uniref:acyl-CoA dehydrogenase family protein n=1 Tax=Synechococcus sp. (strain ATCC 29403 / PCC 7335) TaxID=91464 RepID=UPI00017EBBD1|nr:acyl-CoA dehydrogenase family protein [Synechococcus sp. PCC 7335]EDX86666.1 hypothetical protein S7335_4371 [Synechococcus sp. PCC 7335]